MQVLEMRVVSRSVHLDDHDDSHEISREYIRIDDVIHAPPVLLTWDLVDLKIKRIALTTNANSETVIIQSWSPEDLHSIDRLKKQLIDWSAQKKTDPFEHNEILQPLNASEASNRWCEYIANLSELFAHKITWRGGGYFSLNSIHIPHLINLFVSTQSNTCHVYFRIRLKPRNENSYVRSIIKKLGYSRIDGESDSSKYGSSEVLFKYEQAFALKINESISVPRLEKYFESIFYKIENEIISIERIAGNSLSKAFEEILLDPKDMLGVSDHMGIFPDYLEWFSALRIASSIVKKDLHHLSLDHTPIVSLRGYTQTFKGGLLYDVFASSLIMSLSASRSHVSSDVKQLMPESIWGRRRLYEQLLHDFGPEEVLQGHEILSLLLGTYKTTEFFVQDPAWWVTKYLNESAYEYILDYISKTTSSSGILHFFLSLTLTNPNTRFKDNFLETFVKRYLRAAPGYSCDPILLVLLSHVLVKNKRADLANQLNSIFPEDYQKKRKDPRVDFIKEAFRV